VRERALSTGTLHTNDDDSRLSETANPSCVLLGKLSRDA
jgi:hypothetical protein